MGYHIAVDGGFRLQPPAAEPARVRISEAGRGWRVSHDGSSLELPDQAPGALETLRILVESVLPDLGIVPSGELTWRGEDGAVGRVSVVGQAIQVESPQEEDLPELEIARVLQALASGSKDERLQAAEVLEAFGVSTTEPLRALSVALGDPDLEVRMRAANTLAGLGPDSAPIVGALVAALDDPEPWMQAAAAEALGAIGPGAAEAIPALERLATHPSYGPAGRAKEALARIRS
jgi:hypothetical protein